MPLESQSAPLTSNRTDAWPHSQPLLSSRLRDWNGILVEVHRVRDVDIVVQHAHHVVSLLLRGPINLLQRRNGIAAQRTMHAGDVIITPVGEPKLLRHRETAEILKLHIEPSFLERVVEDMDGPSRKSIRLLDNFGVRDAHIEGLARALLAEARTDRFAGRIYVESLTNQLAVHLLRHYSSARRPQEDPAARLPRYKLDRATDFINENLREDLSLEQISRTLSMSAYHFAHVFKQTVGRTPHRYVTECRVERAKSLLRETELPVTQIAHQVGYSNQSHFSTVFHRFTGKTPRAYRRDA